MAKTYVLDTNVLMQAPYAMQCFEDNHVVIPLVVVEELDELKKADGERGFNARQAIRFLERLRLRGNLLDGVPLDHGGTLRVLKSTASMKPFPIPCQTIRPIIASSRSAVICSRVSPFWSRRIWSCA